MRWQSYGPRALLFELAECVGERAFQCIRAIVAQIETRPPPGLVEYVPAFTTILLEFDPKRMPHPAQIAPELLEQFEGAASVQPKRTEVHTIPVTYDGEDLPGLSDLKQMTISQIRELHAAPVYKVYMMGFAPGFPYLGDLDPRLFTPRRPVPRTKVKPGAVAIGGEHTGIYTVESPGGWNIIGHTPVKIFDVARGVPAGSDEDMFLLKPGDRVKFVAMV